MNGRFTAILSGLTQGKWLRRNGILLALGLFGAGTVLGQSVQQTSPHYTVADDLHLNAVPRTAAEGNRIAVVTANATAFETAEPYESLPAGASTVAAQTGETAFGQPSSNLGFDRGMDFALGQALFDKVWVAAPSSTLASDGLGPLYNARSCAGCHLRAGRGHPPQADDTTAVSLVLRVFVPADPLTAGQARDWLAHLPDPVYGTQLQEFDTSGLPAEMRLDLTYSDQTVGLADGQTVALRQPAYDLRLGYGPLAAGAQLSARIAPQLIGLGLLDAIPAADILALADPDDQDADGISGRGNVVWSHAYGSPLLGRFGHKAGMPTLRDQIAAAFSADIGISTPVLRDPAGDCTLAQTACQLAPTGDGDLRGTEIDGAAFDLVAFYSGNLAVPARRGADDAEVLLGKQVFYGVGCPACHQPKFVTARLTDQPEQSFQLIWPYSDLLLHDMGPGLADQAGEGLATGAEWRTAPLWGIGLTAQVSGSASFLHDGRARTLLEAILWHGGEAQAQRDAVTRLTTTDRAALITYLESL